jgi:CheY-specific phosphatase CheX
VIFLERGIIEFFKNSVEQLLDEIADIGVKKVELIPYKNTNKFETGVVVIFTLSGDKSGEIMFAFGNDVIEMLLKQINKDLFNSNKKDELYSATILEFCNMIVGKTITQLLEDNGLELNISSPIMILSELMEIKTFKKESVHLKFDSSIGNFSIFLSMVETLNNDYDQDISVNDDIDVL